MEKLPPSTTRVLKFSRVCRPFFCNPLLPLLIDPQTMPSSLVLTAWTEQEEIMAIRHRDLPMWGVQFHPESLATDSGIMVLKNFLKYC